MDNPEESQDLLPPKRMRGGKRGPTVGKSARDRAVARLYFAGWPMDKLAKKFNCDNSTIYRLLRSPDISDYLDQLAKPIEERLVELERLALDVKARVLEAGLEDDQFLEAADRAASDILNRAGRRGKPSDSSESKSLHLHGDMATLAIAKALQDPGVQNLLEKDPSLRQKLLPRPATGHVARSGGLAAEPPSEGGQGPEEVPGVQG